MFRGLSGKLRVMPNSDDPGCVALDAIEKSIRRDYQFPVWKFRKFRYNTSRFGKLNEPLQDRSGALAKILGCLGVILSDMLQGIQELASCGGGELNFHASPSARSSSASSRTSFSRCPFPAAISFSPRARSRRSSRSCSERS